MYIIGLIMQNLYCVPHTITRKKYRLLHILLDTRLPKLKGSLKKSIKGIRLGQTNT